MDNPNLIDQIYELEASCAAIVAEARERAAGMEIFAKQEAEKAMLAATNEIYQTKKLSTAERARLSSEKLHADSLKKQTSVHEALKEARAHKALAVAALVERTLG